MTRRRYRIIAARRLHDGTAALWRTSTVRRRAAGIAATGITVLKIAPQQHGIIALGAGIWAVAAWRAGAAPPEDAEALTSNDSGQKGPDGGGGEGITILNTTAGTATLTDDPNNPARTNIRWDKT